VACRALGLDGSAPELQELLLPENEGRGEIEGRGTSRQPARACAAAFADSSVGARGVITTRTTTKNCNIEVGAKASERARES
jgi:hypothetical protein